MRSAVWFFCAGMWLSVAMYQATRGNAWLALFDGLLAAGNVAVGAIVARAAS